MPKRFPSGRGCLFAAVALLVPVAGPGCLPGPGVGWLPDSSGFYYTGGKRGAELRLFDVGKKASQVVLSSGGGPASPAVSPDGRRIALARRLVDGKRVSVVITVLNRKGKELHRSPRLTWHYIDAFGGDIIEGSAPQVQWSPGTDKLLLSSDGRAGLYDLKARRVQPLPTDVASFGNTPVRPDGKGFLGRSTRGFVLVDWQGKARDVDSGFSELFAESAYALEGESLFKAQLLAYPWLHASRWEGQTAVVAWSGVRFRVDTTKRTAVLGSRRLTRTADRQVIQQAYTFPGKGAVVRVVELRPRTALRDKGGLGAFRLEVMRRGAKEPVTLVKRAGRFTFFPSPDRKKLAIGWGKTVWWTDPAWDKSHLLVLDDKGVVLARIDDAS